MCLFLYFSVVGVCRLKSCHESLCCVEHGEKLSKEDEQSKTILSLYLLLCFVSFLSSGSMYNAKKMWRRSEELVFFWLFFLFLAIFLVVG